MELEYFRPEAHGIISVEESSERPGYTIETWYSWRTLLRNMGVVLALLCGATIASAVIFYAASFVLVPHTAVLAGFACASLYILAFVWASAAWKRVKQWEQKRE